MTTETKNNTTRTATGQNGPQNPMEAATACFQAACDATSRFQQDMLAMMFGGTGASKSIEDVQQRTKSIAEQTVQSVQNQMETSRKLFDQTSRTGLELLDKCLATTGENTEQRDAIATARNYWQHTFEAMRDNSNAIAKANADMVENVSRYANETMKLATPVGNSR